MTRQVSIVDYINDFGLMMAITIGSIMLLLLLRLASLCPASKPAISVERDLRFGPRIRAN